MCEVSLVSTPMFSPAVTASQGLQSPSMAARVASRCSHRAALLDHCLHAADEIDAIGKARGSGGGDAGTQEREQGLMQMLYEMDGFASNDGVLVVGATNRVNLLDDALLRKGRFDLTIYMGRPSTNNRFKILQVGLRLWPAQPDIGLHAPAAACRRSAHLEPCSCAWRLPGSCLTSPQKTLKRPRTSLTLPLQTVDM